MTSLVSILIPAYNAEKWLGGTLDSAVAQTWPHREIIVVDDGSKDATLAIAERYASRGVTVVSQPNAGAAAARNTALAHCRGDYIQWLDADDLLAPDKIARQMEALPRVDDRTLLSAAWGRFMYRPGRAAFVPTALWADLPPAEWLRRKMELNLHMQTATWLVSRTLSEAAGPWNTRLLGDDDGEYFCRVLLQSSGVTFVPESRVYYRMTANSLSYIGQSTAKMDAQMHSMRLHIGYLRSLEDSDRVHAACVRYLEHWLPFFRFQRPDLVAEAERMAADLHGQLHMPELSWKYTWIRSLFGNRLAAQAQVSLPRLKWALFRSWDRTLHAING